jgi:gas vesicle protein
MNTTVKVLGGFLVGAVAGTVAGLLFAPDSGKKTRKRLFDESNRLRGEFSDSVSHTIDSAKKTYNEKLDEYAKNGKSSIDTLKESMKA